MTPIRDARAFDAVRDAGLAKLLPTRPRIAVGMGTCGTGNGAEGVYHAFADAIDQRGLDVQLVQTGCFGFCAEEPLVNVWHPGKPLVMLHRVQARSGQPNSRWPHRQGVSAGTCAVQDRTVGPRHGAARLWQRAAGYSSLERGSVLQGQKKIVLRNCGLINPDDIEEYIGDRRLPGAVQGADRRQAGDGDRADQGGQAARPRRRGLLDRHQMGVLRKAVGDRKYHHLQCRRRRSRRLHESQRDRERSAFAAGRHDHRRLRHGRHRRASSMFAPNIRWRCTGCSRAIEQARDYGLLGENILGRGFNFDIELVEGAGAFVCGEETALIARWKAMPGARGRVRRFPRRRACGAIPPTSTTSRPGTTSRPSSPRVRRGSPKPAATQPRHQSLLAGRQGAEHRPGRDAAGHPAQDVRLRRRRRQRARP